jgi:hypothetical protein
MLLSSCSRSLQISEFLKLNPSAQLVNSANGPSDPTTTYTLSLQTGSAGVVTMHVVLGPLFPERPPACQLTTPLQALRLHHRYLDASGYLSLHPKLQPAAWTPHSNLGLLIQGLAAEIVQSPPQLVGGQAPAFSASSTSPSAQQQQQQQQPQLPGGYGNYSAHQRAANGSYNPPSSQQQFQPQQQQQSQSQPSGAPAIPPRQHSPPASSASISSSSSAGGVVRTRPPDVPTHFPQLDSMSIGDLEDVLWIGEEAVKDQAAEVDVLKQLEARTQELAAKVTEKARENLAQRAQLESLTAQLSSESARLREAQQHHASLLHRQQRTASKFTLAHLLHQLEGSIAEADEQSEETKARFEELPKVSSQQQQGAAAGNEDQVLLEQFIKQRMIMHERAAKKERLIEIYGRQ